jgi:uncharacterized protein YndB with AHSA1/START domain
MAEVRLEIELAHPPERVWRALTDAQLLGEWFMPTDLVPEEGARFTLEPGTLAGFLGPVSGELTELARPRRLVMLWQGEKLHTRVVWELTGTDHGCQLQIVQSGFIGAPATLRGRALRDTYTRLFAEQLPATLERLAGGVTAGQPGSVPRQRRPPANVAVGAWAAGRSLGPSLAAAAARPASIPVGEVPAPRPPADAGGEPLVIGDAGRAAAVSRSVAAAMGGRDEGRDTACESEDAALAGAATGAGAPAGPERPAWRRSMAAAPSWVRALAISAAAAVLVVAVLAAVVHTPGPEIGAGDQPPGPDGGRDAPGVALQPGSASSHADPESPGSGPAGAPGESPVAGTGGEPAPAGAGSDPVPGRAGSPEVTPTDGGQPASTAGPSPVLAAEMSTSGLPLVGGRAVTVTVSNPGPGSADGWQVVMNVDDQNVTNVTGAAYQPDGSLAVFTPLDAELAAGASTEFSFDVTAPVLGLLGANDPTDCTIDGQPCG